MEIIAKVKEVIKPALEKHNVNLYDVEFVKDNNDWFLRIYIENEDGTMDLDTCVDVSQDISIILDNEDPIDHIYVLEVSSPGAERPLLNSKHIEDSIAEVKRIAERDSIRHINDSLKQLQVVDIDRYKLYPTQNTWTFLELDTQTGRVWQVQYSVQGSS